MSNATRVYLIRHGETAMNREQVFRGHLDVPLNETGLAEAEAVAAVLADRPLAAIYSSPLSRARQTVAPLARRQGLDVTARSELIDIDFGSWEGRPLAAIRAEQGELLERWEQEPQLVRFPEGETIAEVRERALGALREIVAAHPAGEVAVCSHRVVLKMLAIGLTGLPDSDFWRVYLETASISTYLFDGPRIVEEYRNRTDHLAPLAGKRLHADF